MSQEQRDRELKETRLYLLARTEAFSALPPLKPNQPNQINTVPKKTRVVL
jgi:hypothetical protein